ncbi:glycosyltransferase family 1 protein [Trichocoleus sp. FACHB-262]|uniref:glycosyltransferase family 4 protein n=1 Tax=Trichocoleus sp. FACHB-262 TaxID=2692869 RepID=UPI0016881D1A|nr:glycosyltransferase family 1 protein [Trichocoleus sp. FACHB-262]MBD2121669.1 glycosyltransferase family 4 protein [Trichocoleus sp. FACHB-262]
MKVLYDISVLGAGYYHPRARTGIFRVVENIAYGLASSKECDLSFCAGESFQQLNCSLDYLKFSSLFKEISLPETDIIKIKRGLDTKICDLNLEISNIGNEAQIRLLYLKIWRKLLYSIDKIVGDKSNYLICPKSLEQTDIFHSPFYPIPEQARQRKNKYVFLTVYDLIPIMFPQFFEFDEDHLLNKILDSLDPESWVICISDSTKNDLCNKFPEIDPLRVFVTPLAASELFYPCNDPEQISSIRKKYNLPEAPYILSLSTLEPRKNIDHTIRCFVKLSQQEHIKDLYLVLVGTKGWDYSKIFDEISHHQYLKDRIIVTGYVADEDLAALYSGAIAFVYPSFYEGFGLPPLEAMQCGVPVITSNTSSLPEVVGDAGIMVSPTDADALCQSMLEIYNNPSLRETMSLSSIERSKQFSWEKCTQETINAYKTALSS